MSNSNRFLGQRGQLIYLNVEDLVDFSTPLHELVIGSWVDKSFVCKWVEREIARGACNCLGRRKVGGNKKCRKPIGVWFGLERNLGRDMSGGLHAKFYPTLFNFACDMMRQSLLVHGRLVACLW